jgi:hypothetical protein
VDAVIFGSAALALAAAGHAQLAVAFAVVAVVDTVLVRLI